MVIPLYNHASYIATALESVIAQGRIVKEVIVIDDGSSDDSLLVAKAFAGAQNKLFVLEQENRGSATTLNRGISQASGEYLAILNSDDLWAPSRLDRLVRALDLDPGVSLAASSIAFVDDIGATTLNPWYEAAFNNYLRRRDFGLAIMDANFLMTTSNFVLRRQVFDQLGDFADLRYAHDMDFCLRLAANGHRVAFIDEPLLSYRFHGGNTIKENHARVRVEWAMAASFFLWKLTRDKTHDAVRVNEGWTILEQHTLTAAAQECVKLFEAYPSDNLASNPIISDATMTSKLLTVV